VIKAICIRHVRLPFDPINPSLNNYLFHSTYTTSYMFAVVGPVFAHLCLFVLQGACLIISRSISSYAYKGIDAIRAVLEKPKGDGDKGTSKMGGATEEDDEEEERKEYDEEDDDEEYDEEDDDEEDGGERRRTRRGRGRGRGPGRGRGRGERGRVSEGEAKEEEEEELPNPILISVALCAHLICLSRQTQMEDLAIKVSSLGLHVPYYLT
jgi:hypothetical protein